MAAEFPQEATKLFWGQNGGTTWIACINSVAGPILPVSKSRQALSPHLPHGTDGFREFAQRIDKNQAPGHGLGPVSRRIAGLGPTARVALSA